jgi:predicted MFS family arabinose efflux permease
VFSDRTYKWPCGDVLAGCFFNYADLQSIYSVFPAPEGPGLQLEPSVGLWASSFVVTPARVGLRDWWETGSSARPSPAGFIFWSLVTLAFSFATKYWHVVALRAIEGFGEAFYFPAAMALISAYHGKDTRSRAMGIHQSSVYAGTVAGGTLGGWMGQHYGWRSSFSLLGVLGIVFGFVLFALLKEPPEQSPAPDRPKESLGGILRTIGDVFRVPMVWVLMAVFVGANFVAMVFLVWLPKFLFEKFNMSLSMAGFSATAYLQVASVLGVLCILADRLADVIMAGA